MTEIKLYKKMLYFLYCLVLLTTVGSITKLHLYTCVYNTYVSKIKLRQIFLNITFIFIFGISF